MMRQYDGTVRQFTRLSDLDGLVGRMMRQFDNDVGRIRDGLLPENLAYWYDKIISESIEMAPPWLQDKIMVKQDPILPMKFDLDISKRAVRYFAIAIDNNLDSMPSSTRIYFLKVQKMISSEMDKSLV